VSDKLVPSGLSTTATIAALTWTRMVRGRALWVGFLVSVLPLMYSYVRRSFGETSTSDLFGLEVLILAVLAPMFIGASIGEEIEDRTTTYLWSRPVPRWAVFAGKLLTLAPLATAIVLVSWVGACLISSEWPTLQSCLALAAGAFAISFVSTGIATLVPRHGMAISIVYFLFFDFPVGIMPATVRELSIAHQVRTLAGTEGDASVLSAAIFLSVVSGLWLLLTALRVRRMEA